MKNCVHLLKKRGANRKQAYADREEFTDRSASCDTERRERKESVIMMVDAKCAHKPEALRRYARKEEV